MQRILVLILSAFISFQLDAQVRFYSHSDAKQIVEGQFFTVSFSLENARGSNFQAPSFVEFDVVSGPNTSQEMTFLNGQSKQKLTYSFTLTSDKIGSYTIGSASITVNGQQLSTQPLAIEVLKGRTLPGSGDPGQDQLGDFIIEAQLDFDTGYVGQQLTLKYQLLTTKEVRSYNFRKLPEFDGFFAQEIQNSSSRTDRIVRDGAQYFRKTLKVIALFPQQKGKFSLKPASVTLGVLDGRRPSSFFFNTRLKQFHAKSNAITINILSTPKDPPVSFSGAIGSFYLGTAVDKRSITMNDAITLTLQVRGYGDNKFIEAPEQPYTDLFDIYDPNLLQEKTEIIGEKIQSTKTYEYLMIPKKTGLLTFNPELSHYDVDSARYITIYAQQYQVNVVEGSDRELADLSENQANLIKPRPIISFASRGRPLAFTMPYYGVNGLILLGLAGLLITRKVVDHRENIDPAIKRAMYARKIAIKKLEDSRVHLDNDDIKMFYIALRQGLINFLADKTIQDSNQLSKAEISILLKDNDLEEYERKILEILQKGEQAIYASIAPGKEEGDYKECLQIIEDIELSLS